MGTKHGPNRRANYEQVHHTIMQQFLRENFVLSEDLRFDEADGYLLLRGDVRCLGGLVLEVKKRIKILEGAGPDALIQTEQYKYHGYASGRGSLFRYCSPHGHRPYHHVHRFDVEWRPTPIEEIRNEKDIPTLGEVLDELRDTYYSSDRF